MKRQCVKDKDDFGRSIETRFVDGKTRFGPWAIMSPASFKEVGVGLGMGRGQLYERQEDGSWLMASPKEKTQHG